jgi:hypothetical protein
MNKLLILLVLLCSLPAMAIEEPSFERVKQVGEFELRRYAPYVVAEVQVNGNFNNAGNQGFRLLANYIFGGNQGERKLAMTAPVTQQAEPVKLAMTAPVTQSALADGSFRVQFVLPSDVTMDTAPKPNNPKVQLRLEPARLVAVQRYSGMWTQANYDEQLALLRAAAVREGLKLEGEPVLARFNGPFTLPFMRRNEIWLRVAE